MLVMQALARGKRGVARGLDSPAMAADAFQSTACFYLAFIVLAGTSLNALFGLWWADGAAALAMVVPLAQEAAKSWGGEHRH
jgi:divalent metal cation (Fe/Co/Zn/Cd) transporter